MEEKGFGFDIRKYNELPETDYWERIRFINWVTLELKGEELIAELKFIRLQIIEYNKLTQINPETQQPTGIEKIDKTNWNVVNEINSRIKYQEELLRLKRPKPQIQPQPPAEFGEELAAMVREALEARGLLEGGKFTGKTTHVKALFNVLEVGGALKGTYRPKRFAAFFEKYFNFRITGRTLQGLPNKGQDKEEREFKQLFPFP